MSTRFSFRGRIYIKGPVSLYFSSPSSRERRRLVISCAKKGTCNKVKSATDFLDGNSCQRDEFPCLALRASRIFPLLLSRDGTFALLSLSLSFFSLFLLFSTTEIERLTRTSLQSRVHFVVLHPCRIVNHKYRIADAKVSRDKFSPLEFFHAEGAKLLIDFVASYSRLLRVYIARPRPYF